jgi:hypothetical protein
MLGAHRGEYRKVAKRGVGSWLRHVPPGFSNSIEFLKRVAKALSFTSTAPGCCPSRKGVKKVRYVVCVESMEDATNFPTSTAPGHVTRDTPSIAALMFATERALLQSWSGYRRCLEEKNRATLYET